jgi:hypothetical protein
MLVCLREPDITARGQTRSRSQSKRDRDGEKENQREGSNWKSTHQTAAGRVTRKSTHQTTTHHIEELMQTR